jgi:2-polyprenyl-3-methyl-5-hydroxy-6-metoxy-1,4-benzoquinol methylase
VFVNPQLKESAVLKYYSDDLPSNDRALDFLSSPRQQETDEALYDEMFGQISPQIPRGRVLDIGCSFGLFLKTAKDRGYKVQGLELNEKAAAYGREKFGIPIEAKLLEDCRFPDASFDVVSMFGVIEHLPHPVEVISEIRRILKPGGMFVGRCPNVASLVCMILRGEARTFTARVHLSYFSERTLAHLLRDKVGFVDVRIDTFVSGRDSLLNFMQFLDPFGDETLEYLPERFRAFLRDPVRAEDLERAVGEMGLGYKLKFFAVK